MRELASWLRAMAWLSLVAWTLANLARPRAARALHTFGALTVLLHSALALQLYDWSHAVAAKATSDRIEEFLGWSSGVELWGNYLFLLAWSAEVGWMWLSPAAYQARPRWLRTASRALFLVMFGSGAIVFARGPVRVLGVIALTTVVAAWLLGPDQRESAA